MLLPCNPQEAYRRVDFDARVAGANQRELVSLCLERLVAALGSAIFAAQARDNHLKSRSLTRAIAALTALQLGIDHTAPLSAALSQMYGAARSTLLDNSLQFEPGVVEMIRGDFAELAAVLG